MLSLLDHALFNGPVYKYTFSAKNKTFERKLRGPKELYFANKSYLAINPIIFSCISFMSSSLLCLA